MKNKQGVSRKVSPFSSDLQELWKGKSVALLQALHLVTREGQLTQDTRRKLKQVYHLIQLIEPLLKKATEGDQPVLILDVGAGKSYLGFLLYDLILREMPQVQVVGLETRADLVERSTQLAQQEGFERLKFWQGAAEDFPVDEWKGHTVLVMALHACDTATDDAILLGWRVGAKGFALVPCCQAEVARQLESIREPDHLEQLWRAPIHRREFGSHLTNVLRVLAMQSRGYRVSVTELVGWEHSMKNELIIADRISDGYAPAREKLESLLKEIPVHPKVLKGMR